MSSPRQFPQRKSAVRHFGCLHLAYSCTLILSSQLSGIASHRLELIGVHSTALASLARPLPLSPSQAAWLVPAASCAALCCIVRCSCPQPCLGPALPSRRPWLAVAVLSAGSTQLTDPPLLQVRDWSPAYLVCCLLPAVCKRKRAAWHVTGMPLVRAFDKDLHGRPASLFVSCLDVEEAYRTLDPDPSSFCVLKFVCACCRPHHHFIV